MYVNSVKPADKSVVCDHVTQFFLHTCDRAGQVLDRQRIEARDIYGALAKANSHLEASILTSGPRCLAPLSRIDVATFDGQIVARLVCSEAIAASGITGRVKV